MGAEVMRGPMVNAVLMPVSENYELPSPCIRRRGSTAPSSPSVGVRWGETIVIPFETPWKHPSSYRIPRRVIRSTTSGNKAFAVSPSTGETHRVSFGSSKGSMVETLIYDDTCPLERTSDHVDYVASEAADGVPDYRQRHRRPNVFQKLNSSSLAASEITESHYERASLAEDGSDQEAERSLSKVRVTFYESQRPLTVNSPDPPGNPFRALDDTLDQSYVHSGVDLSNMVFGDLRDGSASFNQTLTAENGSENPFRPDGELSKEADAIVERIREGKPLTPTRGTDDVDAGDAAAVSNSSARGQHAATSDSSAPAASMSAAPGSPSSPSGAALAAEHVSRVDAGPGSSASPPPSSSSSSPSKLPQSPGKPLSPSRAGGANGNTPGSNQPTSVEVQRSVVGSPTQQVERVVIKKTKSKNKCCVIQ